MKVKLIFLLAAAGLLFVAACTDAAKPPALVANAPTGQPTPPPDEGHDAPRISIADAKKDYDAGSGVIIDVRDASAYKQEHIKGALHIPMAEAAANEDKIPKNKKIIVYCS